MATISWTAASQGRRNLVGVWGNRPSAGPLAALEDGDSFTDRNPSGMAGSSLIVRKMSPRWGPQRSPNAATNPQIAFDSA
eukprot:6826113-Pyramimonas_sp.AAC.1